MIKKEIYKKNNNSDILELFDRYNMTRFWKQYLPKEIIDKDQLENEENDKINYFEFERRYCGNNILDGPFNQSIKNLFFLYNKEINIIGIYITKKHWYIFYRIDNKFKYLKINYELFDFEKTKNEYINYIIRKSKLELEGLKKLINYLKKNNKHLEILPGNMDYPDITKTFQECMNLPNDSVINYRSIILNKLLKLNIAQENEYELSNFLVLWNSTLYNFREKLSDLIAYLKFTKLNPNKVIKSNEIDFILETKKTVYGVVFFDFKINKKIFIDENSKTKKLIKSLNDKIFFPFESKIFDKYVFNYQVIFNLLDKVQKYKKIVKGFASDKNLDIKLIIIFDNKNFILREEIIEKIKLIITNYNSKYQKYKLDDYAFVSNLF